MEISKQQFSQITKILNESLNIKDNNIFTDNITERTQLLNDMINQQNNHDTTISDELSYYNNKIYTVVLWESSNSYLKKMDMIRLLDGSYFKEIVNVGCLYGEESQCFFSLQRAAAIDIRNALVKINNIRWIEDKLYGDVIFKHKLIENRYLKYLSKDADYKGFEFIPRIEYNELITFDVKSR